MDVLPGLAALLFKEGIIPMMVLPTTAPVLLNALKDAICADYHNLEKFIYILKELAPQVATANSFLEDYSEFIHIIIIITLSLLCRKSIS